MNTESEKTWGQIRGGGFAKKIAGQVSPGKGEFAEILCHCKHDVAFSSTESSQEELHNTFLIGRWRMYKKWSTNWSLLVSTLTKVHVEKDGTHPTSSHPRHRHCTTVDPCPCYPCRIVYSRAASLKRGSCPQGNPPPRYLAYVVSFYLTCYVYSVRYIPLRAS